VRTILLIALSGALPHAAPAQVVHHARPAAAGDIPVYTDGALDLEWTSTDCGAGVLAAGTLVLEGSIGQHDAGPLAGPGGLALDGGFWMTLGPQAPCYANCDQSTVPPALNILDFGCFLNRFASADPYANCDGSTVPPALNVLDFNCFLNQFAAGCP
jgi:hypothetical protein